MIQSFELVSISESSGLTKVTAKVTVRIEDFRVYIKEVASGSASVGEGLFAKIKTEANQSKNAVKILQDNFLQPLARGEGLQIQVGPPVPFSQSPFANDINIVQSSFVQKLGLSSIIAFELSITLNDNFWKNSERSLISLSSSSGSLKGQQSGNFNVPQRLREEDSIIILVREPIEHSLGNFKNYQERMSVVRRLDANFVYYKIDKVRSELRKVSPIGSYFAGHAGVERPDLRNFTPDLVVEITDRSGSALRNFKIDSFGTSTGDILIPTLGIYRDEIATRVPWSVIMESNHNVFGFRDRRFWLLLGVDVDTLRKAFKITARLNSR